MTQPLRIGVVGAAGRMGRTLVQAIGAHKDCILSGAIEAAGSSVLGSDAGTLAGIEAAGVAIGEDAEALFAGADAVLEFTRPDATLDHAALAAKSGTIHVIGTTGLDRAQESALAKSARKTPIVYAPNMSVGVNLLLALVERIAGILDADYDIEIVEMHHRHKVDAPSGTALGLGQAAARGRGVEHDQVALRGRDGVTGERPRGAIGYAALRGGDVIGDHSVIFAGEKERIELTHKAAGREIYARGAIRAALWARDRGPGLYTMRDVLGLDA
jgi:4-hydroxy-tetrahydrodipicolinate reductase